MNGKEKELLLKIIEEQDSIIEEQGKIIRALIGRVERLEKIYINSFVPSKN